MIDAVACPAALADALAAADLDLDRLLTSFDVGYWRVRQSRCGLTLGQRVAQLTALNVLARRAVFDGVPADELHDAKRPAATTTGRPAALLRGWRRSCGELHRAVPALVDPVVGSWLEQYCEQSRDLSRELAEWYGQWLERAMQTS